MSHTRLAQVIFGGRRHKCYMLITRRGIEVTSRGIGPVKVVRFHMCTVALLMLKCR